MTGKLEHTVNIRVSQQSVDMAKTFKELTGVKKSELDRTAHILGLELMDEIRRSGGYELLMENVALRVVSLVKMRHYDEVTATKKFHESGGFKGANERREKLERDA